MYNFHYMQKTLKSNQEENDEFEARMLVAGEKREGFNYDLFFEQFPDAKQHISTIREIVNIQVMREFDIVQQYAQNDGPSREIPDNVNESNNYPRSPSVVLSRNGYKYHKKVFSQLQSSFYRPKLKPYHLYNFRDIQRNSRSSQEGNDEFEAWMLVAGKNEEVSITVSFLKDFRACKNTSSEIREIVNIQVMQEFDIVPQYVQNDGLSEEIANNVSDSDKVNDVEKPSPELPNNFKVINLYLAI